MKYRIEICLLGNGSKEYRVYHRVNTGWIIPCWYWSSIGRYYSWEAVLGIIEADYELRVVKTEIKYITKTNK